MAVGPINETIAADSARAVKLCASINVVLDNSVESIEAVEKQLAGLHDLLQKQQASEPSTYGLSDADVNSMALAFGAYVGEVLRRTLGGYWSYENSMDPTTRVLTLHLENGSEIWPQIKVLKRLQSGPEDNVWHYSQSVIQRVQSTNT
jgi:hypothetical protein